MKNLKESTKIIGLSLLLLFPTSKIPKVKKQDSPFLSLQGAYLGQKAPIKKSEVFLDGFISKLTEPEMCAAFTKDGKEFYFNAQKNNLWAIFYTKEIDGKWIKPRPMAFSSHFNDRDFTMSPDGNKIFFGSNRPLQAGDAPLTALDIYMTVRKDKDNWSDPLNLGSPVNTNFGENYPSVARNGNLYFFSCRNSGMGGCDIYVSHFKHNKYLPPENLGPTINSHKHDWDAFIAPDEAYLIFSSKDREDTIGDQDLYISFRSPQGQWSVAKNMGPKVNSTDDEICPSVTLDGKYLFFTSRRRGQADILWIDAAIISHLKSQK